MVKVCSPSEKQQTALSDYITFCSANWQELLKLPGVAQHHTTEEGKFFLSDQAIAAWLKQLMGSLKLDTVYGKFTALKEGLKGLNLTANVAPHWLENGAEKPPAVHKILKEQKKQTFKEEPIDDPKGAITKEQVMEYALAIILEDKAGNASQTDIINCFLMWCMSGRAHRLGNIRNTRTSDVGTVSQPAGHGEAPKEAPWICLPVTKLLGVMTAKQITETPLVMKFFMEDAISIYLWEAWMSIVPEEAKDQDDKYFFPFQGPEGFDFSRPTSPEQVKGAILACAAWHGQPAHVKHDANSIRRGLAMEVVDLLKRALEQINPQHGRGRSSDTDIVVYCSKGHLVKPGLLHTDVAGIQTAWDNHMHVHTAALKAQLLCVTCGYPDCKCVKCGLLALGKTNHRFHECWLAGRTPGKKAKNWILEFPDQQDARASAWAAHGIHDLPVFQGGQFCWME